MKIYLSAIALFTYTLIYSQGVGVNTDGSMPANSAVLDVKANDKGMLIPRVGLDDTVDVATISSPASSLIVHNTNAAMDGGNGVGIYQWTGSKWIKLIAATNGPGSNGDVLTSQGPAQAPAWKTAAGGGSGCINKIQVFTANGTWIRPTGVDVVFVTLTGGGGGGGGGSTTDGGGGGGGAQAFYNFPVAVTGDIAVAVGAGGVGGIGNPCCTPPNATGGADGGDSSFGTLVAKGGGKGGGGANTGGNGGHHGGGRFITSGRYSSDFIGDGYGSPGGSGGEGFDSVNGVSIIGAGGHTGAYAGGKTHPTLGGGGGGASGLGNGGNGNCCGNGDNGTGYGSGGGGGGINPGDGGNGANGVVIVQWSE